MRQVLELAVAVIEDTCFSHNVLTVDRLKGPWLRGLRFRPVLLDQLESLAQTTQTCCLLLMRS